MLRQICCGLHAMALSTYIYAPVCARCHHWHVRAVLSSYHSSNSAIYWLTFPSHVQRANDNVIASLALQKSQSKLLYGQTAGSIGNVARNLHPGTKNRIVDPTVAQSPDNARQRLLSVQYLQHSIAEHA